MLQSLYTLFRRVPTAVSGMLFTACTVVICFIIWKERIWFSFVARPSSDQSVVDQPESDKKMNLNNLSPMAFSVTQRHGTEPPFSSPLNNNKAHGLYTCVVCNTPVFSSDHKFDSGTGWPSFFSPVNPNNVASKQDYSMGLRTEVHCAKCSAHFGHVFNDGPAPTGLRYCINGAALNFVKQ